MHLERRDLRRGHSADLVEGWLQAVAEELVEMRLRLPHVDDAPAVGCGAGDVADDAVRPRTLVLPEFHLLHDGVVFRGTDALEEHDQPNCHLPLPSLIVTGSTYTRLVVLRQHEGEDTG